MEFGERAKRTAAVLSGMSVLVFGGLGVRELTRERITQGTTPFDFNTVTAQGMQPKVTPLSPESLVAIRKGYIYDKAMEPAYNEIRQHLGLPERCSVIDARILSNNGTDYIEGMVRDNLRSPHSRYVFDVPLSNGTLGRTYLLDQMALDRFEPELNNAIISTIGNSKDTYDEGIFVGKIANDSYILITGPHELNTYDPLNKATQSVRAFHIDKDYVIKEWPVTSENLLKFAEGRYGFPYIGVPYVEYQDPNKPNMCCVITVPLSANELGYWPTTQYVYDNDNIYNFKPLIVEGELHVNRRSSRRDIEPIANPAETMAALGYSLNPAKVKVIDDVEVPSWLIPR